MTFWEWVVAVIVGLIGLYIIGGFIGLFWIVSSFRETSRGIKNSERRKR